MRIFSSLFIFLSLHFFCIFIEYWDWLVVRILCSQVLYCCIPIPIILCRFSLAFLLAFTEPTLGRTRSQASNASMAISELLDSHGGLLVSLVVLLAVEWLSRSGQARDVAFLQSDPAMLEFAWKRWRIHHQFAWKAICSMLVIVKYTFVKMTTKGFSFELVATSHSRIFQIPNYKNRLSRCDGPPLVWSFTVVPLGTIHQVHLAAAAAAIPTGLPLVRDSEKDGHVFCQCTCNCYPKKNVSQCFRTIRILLSLSISLLYDI